MYIIEKNIPIARDNRGGPGKRQARSRTYPFGRMEVGDSFLCTDRTAAQLASASCNYAKKWRRLDRKFTVRTVSDGVRIWRVS